MRWLVDVVLPYSGLWLGKLRPTITMNLGAGEVLTDVALANFTAHGGTSPKDVNIIDTTIGDVDNDGGTQLLTSPAHSIPLTSTIPWADLLTIPGPVTQVTSTSSSHGL